MRLRSVIETVAMSDVSRVNVELFSNSNAISSAARLLLNETETRVSDDRCTIVGRTITSVDSRVSGRYWYGFGVVFIVVLTPSTDV